MHEGDELGGFAPDVQAGLRAALDQLEALPAARRVVAFDFDNTCIRGDIGEAVFHRTIDRLDVPLGPDVLALLPDEQGGAALREAVAALGPVGARDLTSEPARRARYLLRVAYERLEEHVGVREAYAFVVQILAGLTPAELEARATAIFREGLARAMAVERLHPPEGLKGPPVEVLRGLRGRAAVVDLARAARARGARVLVISASAEWIVRGPARLLLDAPPTDVQGVRLAVDAAGALTTTVVEPFTYAEGKVAAIEALTGGPPALAVGDARTDLEMLASSTVAALVIDRGDPDLRAAAARDGWLLQPASTLADRP